MLISDKQTGEGAGMTETRAGEPARTRRRERHRGAAWTLVVLTPLVAELALGSTPVRMAWLVLLWTPVYGAGVLLIRELVARRGRGCAEHPRPGRGVRAGRRRHRPAGAHQPPPVRRRLVGRARARDQPALPRGEPRLPRGVHGVRPDRTDEPPVPGSPRPAVSRGARDGRHGCRRGARRGAAAHGVAVGGRGLPGAGRVPGGCGGAR